MHIRQENGVMIMSEGLVCKNYGDMSHYKHTFEKIGDNAFKCEECGTVMTVKEPVLVHDNKGRLKMQISTEVQ